MNTAHVTAVKPTPGGAQHITCTCGVNITRTVPRDEALVEAWAHEDRAQRSQAAKKRRREQDKNCHARTHRRSI